MNIDQFVSYPGHGIGRVIELKTMNDVEFVSICILDSGLKILVPKSSTELYRPLMSRETAKKCLLLIRESSEYMPETKNQSWKRRRDVLLAKIKSNNPLRIAEVIAELTTRKLDGNELSFGERKMIDAARALVEPEIALVLNEKPTLRRTN